jgi:hypothetical protein
METHFKHQFLMHIWCRTIGNDIIAPFVIEHFVTAVYLKFMHKTLWLQRDGAPPLVS